MNLRIVVPSIAVRGIVVVVMTMTVAIAPVTPAFFKFALFSFDGLSTVRCDDFTLIGSFHLSRSLLRFGGGGGWSLIGRYRSAITVVPVVVVPEEIKLKIFKDN
jgi:hypothetical protein